ncbi:hypothetical protein CEXT_267131 [Caerostris extrusa]|uniref:Uncharacterized protein n=1 Tax=Caerostris extrusa TaxID=172846 RepID=A0AAV4Y7T6_CAEEX|nr:hypothetical protein CEXT_267131 [Caerostris extrusa]
MNYILWRRDHCGNIKHVRWPALKTVRLDVNLTVMKRRCWIRDHFENTKGECAGITIGKVASTEDHEISREFDGNEAIGWRVTVLGGRFTGRLNASDIEQGK